MLDKLKRVWKCSQRYVFLVISIILSVSSVFQVIGYGTTWGVLLDSLYYWDLGLSTLLIVLTVLIYYSLLAISRKKFITVKKFLLASVSLLTSVANTLLIVKVLRLSVNSVVGAVVVILIGVILFDILFLSYVYSLRLLKQLVHNIKLFAIRDSE